MDDLALACEKTFYHELYQLTGENQSLVIDETTQTVYLKKRLTVWREDVLTYLREHENPHVARVKQFWENGDGTLTVIEEYVQGETLAEALSKGNLTEEKRRAIFRDVLDAVSFLHQATPPIIHRDIKPENIMLTADGSAKLIDFDAAKTPRGEKNRDTMLLGTPEVAAPEQYGFAESDTRTDIYALGMLLRALFPGDPFYEKIAEKATRLDPKDRYQSVPELSRAVEKRDSKRGQKWLIPAGIVTLAAIAVVLFFLGYGLAGKKETGTAMLTIENSVEQLSAGEELAVTEADDFSPEETALYAPQLLEQGYGLGTTGSYRSLSFAACVRNPNPEYAMKNVYVEATARNKNGAVLATNYIRIRCIAALDTVYAAYDGVIWENEDADAVEIRLRHGKEDFVRQEGSEILRMDELSVSEVTEREYLKDGTVEYLGEVTNTSEVDLSEACVVTIYRKRGELVGGRCTFVEPLNAGETIAFESIPSASFIDYDDYETYALQWTPWSIVPE